MGFNAHLMINAETKTVILVAKALPPLHGDRRCFSRQYR